MEINENNFNALVVDLESKIQDLANTSHTPMGFVADSNMILGTIDALARLGLITQKAVETYEERLDGICDLKMNDILPK